MARRRTQHRRPKPGSSQQSRRRRTHHRSRSRGPSRGGPRYGARTSSRQGTAAPRKLGIFQRIMGAVKGLGKKPQPGSTAGQVSVNTLPEVNIQYIPALFAQHPELIDRIPWVSLRGAEIPSVPFKLRRSQHLFGENYAFMKKEEMDFYLMPDNKARKLEFILGEALQRKRKKLVTYGFMGSSHCLATVKAANQLGLKSEVVMLKCPLRSEALEMAAAMENLGAKIKFRSKIPALNENLKVSKLSSGLFGSELVPLGGSSEYGALGYVNAFLELKIQIEDGEVERPDFLFVAMGSGATFTGLEIGKRLAGLDSVQIIGMKTSTEFGVTPEKLSKMANAAIDILNQHLVKKLSVPLKPSDFTIVNDYVFGEHAELPIEVEHWMNRFMEVEMTELDPAYTGKALFGMSDYIKKNNLKHKKVLFWNTYSPYRRGDLPENFNYTMLNPKLKKWVREQQSHGGLSDVGRV